MTIETGPPEPIPGLEGYSFTAPQPATGDAPLEGAIRKSLEELHAAGHVQNVDAGKVALAIELARIIDVKQRKGRLSTVSNDARLLMEILDSLVGEAGDVDEQLRAAMEEWAEQT